MTSDNVPSPVSQPGLPLRGKLLVEAAPSLAGARLRVPLGHILGVVPSGGAPLAKLGLGRQLVVTVAIRILKWQTFYRYNQAMKIYLTLPIIFPSCCLFPTLKDSIKCLKTYWSIPRDLGAPDISMFVVLFSANKLISKL